MLNSTACISCNKQIREGIYNSTFYPNLLIMLSAFIVLSIIVAILVRLNRGQHSSLTTASMVLGIGLGGFIDGIVLHQMLQWHEMLSAKVPATDYVGKSINMFWDGVFHFFCLVVVIIGVIMLWRLVQRPEINRSGKVLSGGLLMGWGLFNIVEGIIDHHILKLHNVMEYSPNTHLGNYAFLGASLAMLWIGYLLTTKGYFPPKEVLYT